MPGEVTSVIADFAAPGFNRIEKGEYDSAARFPFQKENQPGMDISGDGRGCNQLKGKFIVRDVHYNQNDELQDIAIDFIQHCEAGISYLSGIIRYNSSFPINFNISD